MNALKDRRLASMETRNGDRLRCRAVGDGLVRQVFDVERGDERHSLSLLLTVDDLDAWIDVQVDELERARAALRPANQGVLFVEVA